MIEALINLLLFPVSAIIAGTIAWALLRKEEADDIGLIMAFMVPFAICATLFFGISRTDRVRMKTDPEFRLRTELETHPINIAVRQFSPSGYARLQEAIVVYSANHSTAAEIFKDMRPWLAKYGTENMGWADAKSRIAWAQSSIDTLSELQERNPRLCFQVLAGLPEGNDALSKTLNPANTKAFEQAFVNLMKSAYLGIANKRASSESNVTLNEARNRWGNIREEVKELHGETIAEIVNRNKFGVTPLEMQDQVCPARIMQLRLMTEQPPSMASMLIDSAMR